MITNNRREFERMPLTAPIRFQFKGSQKYARCSGKDISSGGIGFSSNEFLPVSTELVFEVQHPSRGEFIKALGEVVWVSTDPHSDRYTVGAKFRAAPVPV